MRAHVGSKAARLQVAKLILGRCGNHNENEHMQDTSSKPKGLAGALVAKAPELVNYNGTTNGKKQMLMFSEIYDRADIESGVSASADFHRGAMIHFRSDQNIFRDLPLHDHAPKAPVLIARSGIDAVTAAAINRPVANTLLQPQW